MVFGITMPIHNFVSVKKNKKGLNILKMKRLIRQQKSEDHSSFRIYDSQVIDFTSQLLLSSPLCGMRMSMCCC
jgi:hypothetical protein